MTQHAYHMLPVSAVFKLQIHFAQLSPLYLDVQIHLDHLYFVEVDLDISQLNLLLKMTTV